jgi:DNA repair exonuclease SbcCD ATPase subunit
MSDTPDTPRTDAAILNNGGLAVISPNFARALERESCRAHEVIITLERDLATARERIAALEASLALVDGDESTVARNRMLEERIAALEAERDAIDRELYGEQTLNYNPNRALTIHSIKAMSKSEAEQEARGQLEVAEAALAQSRQRIAELEAERDRLHVALEEMLSNFQRPHRSEWLNEMAWKCACDACDRARAALAREVPAP